MSASGRGPEGPGARKKGIPRAPLLPALRSREVQAEELMDDPSSSTAALDRTYRQFATVNRLVSGWRRLYLRRIRPLLHEDTRSTLLDVGFGGGDIPRALARWAADDGLPLDILAIDPDQRAYDFAVSAPVPHGVEFIRASSSDLVAQGRRFDIVISNHVLHHLDADELGTFLADSAALATRRVLHSDLRRDQVAYGAYYLPSLPFRRASFIHDDGLLSIRRSYRPRELGDAVRAVAGPGWQVTSAFPFRLLLHRDVRDAQRYGSAPTGGIGA